MPNTIKPIGLDTATGQGKTGEAGDSLEISLIRLPGSSSGVVTLSTAAAAGTHTIKLPTADGSAAQVLTTDGAGQWSWSTPAGTGANTTLSNLAAVALNTALLPDAAAADDFGSATLPFKDLWFAGSSGTPGTNNFRLTGTSTGGLRTLTAPDASGTLALTADLLAYIPISYLDTDPTLAANSNSKIATQAAIKAYADQLIAAANALIYKGVIDCSTNPNYPAADAGWLYVVSVAGKIGGVSGLNVEAGDLILCNTDGTVSGNQATVGAFWNVIQKNLDGAVIGPAVSVDNRVVFFDGATGKLIKDSGLTLSGTNTGDQDQFKTFSSQSGSTTANTTTDTLTVNGANGNATAVSGDTLTVTGGGASTWTGDQTVGENLIIMPETLSGDGTSSGKAEPGTAGSTLAVGDLCAMDSTTRKWYKADPTAAALAPGDCRGRLGICILAAAADTDPTRLLTRGKIRVNAWTYLANEQVLIDPAAAGTFANIATILAGPPAAGDIIRAVGAMNNTNELDFQPSTDWMTYLP